MTTHQPPERPIRLYAHEVRAILEGRQTMIRRIVKPPKGYDSINRISNDAIQWSKPGYLMWQYSPFGAPGTVLWVKETWRPVGPYETSRGGATVQYRADGAYERKLGWPENFRITSKDNHDRWHPSIHMGRWASRLILVNKESRVERLKDISEEDARRHGVTPKEPADWGMSDSPATYRMGFFHSWNDTFPGTVAANPLVWVGVVERLET